MTYDVEEIASRTEIVPYHEVDEDLSGFDCGKSFFDNFINTSEIEEYHQEQFGITRLVYFDGELAAFYSLSANALREDDYEGNEMDSLDELDSYIYQVPAHLLGHLAVDKTIIIVTGPIFSQFVHLCGRWRLPKFLSEPVNFSEQLFRIRPTHTIW